MRLTNKASGFIPENAQKYRNAENITHKQIIDKLGQLEDIEEELGINLVTLFKAFKNGIYIKNQGGVHYHKQPYNTLEENIAYFRRLFEKQFVDNYGKTWALTKEELL